MLRRIEIDTAFASGGRTARATQRPVQRRAAAVLIAALARCLIRYIDVGKRDPRVGAFIHAVPGGFRLTDDLAVADDTADDFPQAGHGLKVAGVGECGGTAQRSGEK